MNKELDTTELSPESTVWVDHGPIEPYKPTRERTNILGVAFDNTDTQTALNELCRALSDGHGRRMKKVFFANVHTIQLARRSREYQLSVNAADWLFPDGSGITIAGLLSGTPVRENLNGTDFTPRLLREAELQGWSVYLFGARPNVLRSCLATIRHRFPRLIVAGSHPGYFAEQQEGEIVRDINRCRPDVLLVALGSPLQEVWIQRHQHELHAVLAMAVGGLFDFLSGKRKRAPVWMRKLGIEWAFRFLQDPREKWNRVFVEIPMFLTRVVAQWMLGMGYRLFSTRGKASA